MIFLHSTIGISEAIATSLLNEIDTITCTLLLSHLYHKHLFILTFVTIAFIRSI